MTAVERKTQNAVRGVDLSYSHADWQAAVAFSTYFYLIQVCMFSVLEEFAHEVQILLVMFTSLREGNLYG